MARQIDMQLTFFPMIHVIKFGEDQRTRHMLRIDWSMSSNFTNHPHSIMSIVERTYVSIHQQKIQYDKHNLLKNGPIFNPFSDTSS